MKILVPVDGSDFTRRMLEYLMRHRDLLGREPDLTLLAAVPVVPPHAARYVERDSLAAYYRDEAQAMLEQAERMLTAAGIASTSESARGNAAKVIAERATQGGFDLVVMGSHGHTALGNLVLGSVVTAVIASCQVPVLVVR